MAACRKTRNETKADKKRRRTARRAHSIEVSFSDENVTSFGGMVLEERLASRLGLWKVLEKALPEREGYSWIDVIRSGVAGLLTGSRGTFAAEELRKDQALLDLLGLEAAPEEATLWRCLEGLGKMAQSGRLGLVEMEWVRRILAALSRRDLLECEGFFPVFLDGSLLEGSGRREGTKFIREKGRGLVWGTIFTGPLVAAQGLAAEGQGEESLVRAMLPGVVKGVLEPLKLKDKALVLADSLYGDGPTLDAVEGEGLHYVVGANGLSEARRVLSEQPASQWCDEGPDKKRGWSQSALCVCWIMCEGWSHKRLLVGRRVLREDELFETYWGVMTDFTQADLGAEDQRDFARKVWRLYDAKGRMELGYQELLTDLGLHHPPCQEIVRNSGFYALATLAHTLGMAVKLIGESADHQRRRELAKERNQGAPVAMHLKPKSRGMRLWRVMRRLFTLPARISFHARRLHVEFLGVSQEIREQFERWFLRISRC